MTIDKLILDPGYQHEAVQPDCGFLRQPTGFIPVREPA
jgi:hypothetical protein